MFNDDFLGDFESYSENEENSYSAYKDQIEKEFFESLSKGENLSVYLYLPHFLISDNVKEQLDIFLLKEAYKNLFENENTEMDAVYADSQLVIVIKDQQYKREMLSQMLEYFIKKEEYEKCSKIKSELEKMDY